MGGGRLATHGKPRPTQGVVSPGGDPLHCHPFAASSEARRTLPSGRRSSVVEQPPRKRQVIGSNPIVGSNLKSLQNLNSELHYRGFGVLRIARDA